MAMVATDSTSYVDRIKCCQSNSPKIASLTLF